MDGSELKESLGATSAPTHPHATESRGLHLHRVTLLSSAEFYAGRCDSFMRTIRLQPLFLVSLARSHYGIVKSGLQALGERRTLGSNRPPGGAVLIV